MRPFPHRSFARTVHSLLPLLEPLADDDEYMVRSV